MKLLIFLIHTPKRKEKMKRMSCTNKKTENRKVKFSRPSPLSSRSSCLRAQLAVLRVIGKRKKENAVLREKRNPQGPNSRYFSNGEFQVIFLGSVKFWPKVIFWVYKRRRDFFGSRKTTEGFF